MDGFDLYADRADVLKGGWSALNSGPSMSTSQGRYGGGCLTNNNSARAWVQSLGSIAGGSTVHFAFHYYVGALGSGTANDPIINIFDGTDTTMFRIEHNTSGDVKCYNAAGSQLGSTASAAIVNTAWHWIEVKITFGTTSGNASAKVYLNGSLILNVSSVNIYVGTGINNRGQLVKFYGSNGGSRFDDVIIWDTSGSSVNSFPLGECKIDTLSPNADGTNNDWGKSTGSTRYTLVDDGISGTANDDTDYLTSSTVGDKTDIAMSNLSDNPTTIYATQMRVRAKKVDVGPRTYRVNALVSGSTSTGTTKGAPIEYCWHRSGFFYLDPNTSAAWTAAGINALQMQLELVS